MLNADLIRTTAAIFLGIIATLPVVTRADEAMEVDLVTHSSVLIHASPAQIWPKILDTGEWKAGAELIIIEGIADQVSARFKAVMPDTPDQVAFFVQNVEVQHERRRTVRLTLPDGTMMGFASWELTPLGEGTQVEYHVYSLIVFPESSWVGLSEDDRVKLSNDYQAGNAERFQSELEVLKRLVETLIEQSASK